MYSLVAFINPPAGNKLSLKLRKCMKLSSLVKDFLSQKKFIFCSSLPTS